jgi:S-adenosylmethionine:tRNA ribosyltransferase-isomerase
MGVKLLEYGTSHANDELVLSQWDPYELTPVNRRDALQALLDYAKERSQEHISITTSVLIAPGYTFRICDGLITNFHMPKSTLIVLVAALIGDRWREVYQSAITERYRFLSYGDSSLLIP